MPRKKAKHQLTLSALIWKSDSGEAYVSVCPELGIASHGNSVEHAREMLQEAVEVFFEYASPEAIALRLSEAKKLTNPLRAQNASIAKRKKQGEDVPSLAMLNLLASCFAESSAKPRKNSTGHFLTTLKISHA